MWVSGIPGSLRNSPCRTRCPAPFGPVRYEIPLGADGDSSAGYVAGDGFLLDTRYELTAYDGTSGEKRWRVGDYGRCIQRLFEAASVESGFSHRRVSIETLGLGTARVSDVDVAYVAQEDVRPGSVLAAMDIDYGPVSVRAIVLRFRHSLRGPSS